MLLILERNLSNTKLEKIYKELSRFTFEEFKSQNQIILLLDSSANQLPNHYFSKLDGIVKAISIQARIPKLINESKKSVTLSSFNNFVIPKKSQPVFIAGPCSIESLDQIVTLSLKLKSIGVDCLRGGAFKPRTNPYDFQGLGLEGLKFLKQASIESQLPVVSEIMSSKQLEIGYDYIDIIQIGARNMHNYELLKEVGSIQKPVLLKRSFGATVDEFLQACEYIVSAGNRNIILCERGIRTFETSTRNTLDLNSVAYIKQNFNLPIIVDPSHGTGLSNLVEPLATAALCSLADGIMVEVHENPKLALSDSHQAIGINDLEKIITKSRAIWNVLHSDNIEPCNINKSSSDVISIK